MASALLIGGIGTLALGWASTWAFYIPSSALTGFGLGLAWAFASVATQAVVPPAKAGAASGVVLTVLVGLAGIAVAVAASIIETHGSGKVEDAIRGLLRVCVRSPSPVRPASPCSADRAAGWRERASRRASE